MSKVTNLLHTAKSPQNVGFLLLNWF